MRALRVITTVIFFASLSFGGAIVSGFNATSDGRNDDGTYTTGGCNNPSAGGTCAGTAVPIGFNIDFLGATHGSLYINTNGNVTFDSPLATFTPFSLDDALREIIAPFFADVDTRNPDGGVVTFGNGLFDGRNAFGANWLDVGYFDMEVDNTNSFQLLLVDRSDTGAGNFDIVFNYDRILWEAGDASFGFEGLGGFSARAGFSNGTGLPGTSFELTGSGEPGSFIDDGTNALITNSLNSNVEGRYIFNARNGAIITAVPEPGTWALLVAGSVLLLLFRRAARSCESLPAPNVISTSSNVSETELIFDHGFRKRMTDFPKGIRLSRLEELVSGVPMAIPSIRFMRHFGGRKTQLRNDIATIHGASTKEEYLLQKAGIPASLTRQSTRTKLYVRV